MDEKTSDNAALIAQVEQLEKERDQLRKDIEQLCMQQAGPTYLAIATKMHFQRTAVLEQEIEDLRKKLAVSTRESLDLQEELSEAYRIKSQLADLHNAEVSKSIETEKQLKFFQGCVATAFAERDNAIMEAERAKEKEEIVSQKLDSFQKRIEELTSACLDDQRLSANLRLELEKEEKSNKLFKKVIDKFCEIRGFPVDGTEDISWVDKCECLLHDSADMWTFTDYSETNYITTLEEEVEKLRKSVTNLQNKLRMGLDIESHLKKKVNDLENKRIVLEGNMKDGVSRLLHDHCQHRLQIVSLLNDGYSYLKSTTDVIEEKIIQFHTNGVDLNYSGMDVKLAESNCRDVHMSTDAGSDTNPKTDLSCLSKVTTVGYGDSSDVLAQALQEKVSALLFLSQQEERYLLESNVNAALQKKLEEFQRNILQVTNEKVKALMELAQLKQEYLLLQEKVGQETKHSKISANAGERSIFQDGDGRLKNLLKKTYLRHWINPHDSSGTDAEAQLDHSENTSQKRSSYNMDFARMKIENAALKESLQSMDHLSSSVHRLRQSLVKVKESMTSEGTASLNSEALDKIIYEANLIKTALGSSLPVSWSPEPDPLSIEHIEEEIVGARDSSSTEKVDSVAAAGFEMVELLIFAAQLLLDGMT